MSHGIEEWRHAPDCFDKYEISSHGRFRVKKTGLVCRTYDNGHGYLTVQPYSTEKKRNFHRYVHRLVAITFIGRNEEKLEVNHRDGNKANNRVDNLEWMTPLENNNHAHKVLKVRHICGPYTRTAKLTKDQVSQIRSTYETGELNQTQIAQIYNVDPSTISVLVRNKTWKPERIAQYERV